MLIYHSWPLGASSEGASSTHTSHVGDIPKKSVNFSFILKTSEKKMLKHSKNFQKNPTHSSHFWSNTHYYYTPNNPMPTQDSINPCLDDGLLMDFFPQHSTNFTNIPKTFKKLQNIQKKSKTFKKNQKHSKNFKNIQKTSKTFKKPQKHSKNFKNIQKTSKTFKKIIWGKPPRLKFRKPPVLSPMADPMNHPNPQETPH